MAIIFVENSVGPLFPLLADAPRPYPSSFRPHVHPFGTAPSLFSLSLSLPPARSLVPHHRASRSRDGSLTRRFRCALGGVMVLRGKHVATNIHAQLSEINFATLPRREPRGTKGKLEFSRAEESISSEATSAKCSSRSLGARIASDSFPRPLDLRPRLRSWERERKKGPTPFIHARVSDSQRQFRTFVSLP